VLKEGYLKLKEDNKRLQEQIAALIAASKRAAENKEILEEEEQETTTAEGCSSKPHNVLTCQNIYHIMVSRITSTTIFDPEVLQAIRRNAQMRL
jgi:hypothetical protein